MFFLAKFASAQEGPMARRGPGGGAGVGTPPHTMPTPCQHVRRWTRRRFLKKGVDTMTTLCYDEVTRREESTKWNIGTRLRFEESTLLRTMEPGTGTNPTYWSKTFIGTN